MTLEEMLASINASLKSLADAEAKGETIDTAEKAKLTDQKSTIETEIKRLKDGPQETELERLRREKSEREERDMAKSLVDETLARVAAAEADRKSRVQGYVEEMLKSSFSDGGMDDTVRRVLADNRAPSRFANENADAETVKRLADGGGAVDKPELRVREVGAEAEAKSILESKNLVHFMSMIARNSKGAPMSQGERKFLHDVGQKALSEGTASAGGYLVPQEWMPDILGILRAQAVVRRANPRFVPFNKQMNQTSISSGATAYYTAENAVMTTSEEVFGETALLTPKNLTGMVPVSNYLLADASGADTVVRDDLTEVLALREDLAFLQGNGSGGEPTGFKNMSSITTNPVTPATDGTAFTLPQFRKIKQATRTLNVRNGRWAYFMNPTVVSYLETLTDSLGRFLADANILTYDENAGQGMFDGVPFYTTTQIPVNLTYGAASNSTYLLLVNMAEAVVGINQDLELDVSSEASYTTDGGTTWNSAFQQNQTLFRSVIRHDIAHRRPTQVIRQTGVLIP